MTIKFKLTSIHQDLKQIPPQRMGDLPRSVVVYDLVFNRAPDNQYGAAMNIQTSDKAIVDQYELGKDYEMVISPASLVRLVQ